LARKLEPFFYLSPALLFFLTFTYYPFLKTIVSSFFLVNRLGKFREFVAFENYIRILAAPEFILSVKNTFVYMFLNAPVSIFISLILAIIANRKTRSSKIYETLFALSMAMSMSVAAMIFRLAYNPTIGAFNYLLGTTINWLNDPSWAMISISLIATWLNIGYNFLFLLAAVRGIDVSLIESASLDGAGVVRKTIRIILPIISPTVFFLIVTQMAKSMMMSGLVLIFTNSASLSTTSNIDTMISFMYKQAVNNLNYNDGYATAIMAFIMTFIIMLISFKFEKKGVYYN
jgi:sn-glycerol 3-phosphate transport system permease protein